MSHDYRGKSKNCYAFEDDITFSMKADMRNKNLEQMFTKRIILMSLKR
jgi:hypothetical protein